MLVLFPRLAFALLLVAATAARAQTTEPAPAVPPTQRTVQQILPEFQQAQREFQQAMPSPNDLLDPAKRADLAPKAIPPLKKLVTLSEEIAQAEPRFKPTVAAMGFQNNTILAWLGDADAQAILQRLAKGTDKDDAAGANASLLTLRYWGAVQDEPAQLKVLDDMRALVKGATESNTVLMALVGMTQQGAASPKVRQQAEAVILDDVKHPAARGLQQQILAQRKMRELEGKPLALQGKTIDGKDFTSADWKGKVILVDFWATWCGPCLQEMPRTKKIYQQYHEQGLEMVGISCDRAADDLKGYLQNDPAVTWTQLFDADAPNGWHPIATRYGVEGIPTLFLVDRRGILRSVTAREDMEALIPKLLAEKPD